MNAGVTIAVISGDASVSKLSLMPQRLIDRTRCEFFRLYLSVSHPGLQMASIRVESPQIHSSRALMVFFWPTPIGYLFLNLTLVAAEQIILEVFRMKSKAASLEMRHAWLMRTSCFVRMFTLPRLALK